MLLNVRHVESMSSFRDIQDLAKKSNLDIAETWQHSIQPVQDVITDRFSRLNLKDKPTESVEIKNVQRYIHKVRALCAMEEKSLQGDTIRKCGVDTCCSAPKRPAVELARLPPMLEADKALFITESLQKIFQKPVKKDRPSLNVTKEKKGNTFRCRNKKGTNGHSKFCPQIC